MKRKIVWLVVSCVMAVTLVLVSCGPAVTEEEEEEVVTEEEEEEEVAEEEEEEEGPEMVRDSLGRLVEKPRYGGGYIQARVPPIRFDNAGGHISSAWTMLLTNEDLFKGDWAKGPTGSGDASWLYIMMPAPAVRAAGLAESWELVDNTTLVFNIRKGVHFALNLDSEASRLVNGRELDADDVVYSFMRVWFEEPKAYHYIAYPWRQNFQELDGAPWIEAPDRWTVVIKTLPGRTGHVFKMASDHTRIVPREVIEMYGDLVDWENAVGTGPFMLVDVVDQSSLTMERNPNYWGTDPLHPDNQLPYLDSIQWLVIPDLSTQIAALRTAKIDYLPLNWEEADAVMKTNPELQYLRYSTASASALYFRIDKPELAIANKEVRQALAMAINNQEMIDTYYGGYGDLLTFPLGPIAEFADAYVPPEEMSLAISQQFEYHPDKARQMIADAGYPEGFRTEIVLTSLYVDLLSIVQAYWADIGVELVLDVKDTPVYTSVGRNKSHNQIFYSVVTSTLPFVFRQTWKDSFWNYSMIDDPVINEAYMATSEAFFDEPKRRQIMKDLVPYILDQAWILQLPGSYAFKFWQPWVKGFNGEYAVGYANYDDYVMYIWLDLDMKEELTGRR